MNKLSCCKQKNKDMKRYIREHKSEKIPVVSNLLTIDDYSNRSLLLDSRGLDREVSDMWTARFLRNTKKFLITSQICVKNKSKKESISAHKNITKENESWKKAQSNQSHQLDIILMSRYLTKLNIQHHLVRRLLLWLVDILRIFLT